MSTPAETAHLDQLAAAARDGIANVSAMFSRVCADLRAQIRAGEISRADAIASLRNRWALTEIGAADLLDRRGN